MSQVPHPARTGNIDNQAGLAVVHHDLGGEGGADVGRAEANSHLCLPLAWTNLKSKICFALEQVGQTGLENTLSEYKKNQI